MTAAGARAAVATSHPLAVRAALDALADGGTAADAAVAAAAVLCVVDPRSTGIAGDAFAIHWAPGASAPVGLAAAGPSAAGLTLAALRGAGHASMPAAGPWSVTVPGAVAGWATLLERFGALGLARALQPAIRIAEAGFPVSPVVAAEWSRARPRLAGDAAASEIFLPGGRPPRPGERFANRALGRALRAIAADGPDVMYRGPYADAIAGAVARAGGPLRAHDLAAWEGPTWVPPLRMAHGDHEVFELPPPNQGVVVLEALALTARVPAPDPHAAEHVAIEALKAAAADAAACVGDPDAGASAAGLLDAARLDARAGDIDVDRAAAAAPGRPADTVYVAVMTRDRGTCSFIQSVYEGFGSGLGVLEIGSTLHNRGACFTTVEGHPNAAGPRRRPFHTIIPAVVARDGAPLAALGVVGGLMQPQGQLQVLRAILDRGVDPQAALDAPRWRALGGRRLAVEDGFDPQRLDALRRRGHDLEPLPRWEAGGAQVAMRRGERLVAASDRRKDGVAAVR